MDASFFYKVKMAEPNIEVVRALEAEYSGSPRGHLIDGVIDLTGGALSSFASVYVGQPLDTVKVKLQAFPNYYNGALDCLVKTLRQDGIVRGLYAGTVPALVADVSESAVLFCAYGACQKLVANARGHSDLKNLDPLDSAIAGSGAAVFSSLTLCPTELIKCRLQALREMNKGGASPGPRPGVFSMTSQILRAEGIRGMFKGLTSTMVREIPGYFFFFGGYEFTRQLVTPPGQSKDDIGHIKTVLCGGTGGTLFWVVIYPADVCKSRIQILAHEGKTPTFVTTFMKILREEGITRLYRGLTPTIVRTFPATGVVFLVYEGSKKWLTKMADNFLAQEE